MKVPYLKLRQRGEIFFVSKFKVEFLRERVNFHFRDPYFKYQSRERDGKYQDYLEKIRRKGIQLVASDEGIQRRLQIYRINDIMQYVEASESNFFPNSILLSVDVSNIEGFEADYLKYEESDFGEFDLPDSVRFSVIDGQHRLAGLFQSDPSIVNQFELPAVLLFNVSLSTAAKLFADINGKQKAVSRSLIYDLYEEIDSKEIDEIKKFHLICQKFYTDSESPLYRQIKMLGIGDGAISQAFFIDYVIDALKSIELKDKPAQEIYSQLFLYFRAFQITFPDDWPVPISFSNHEELQRHSEIVLKKRKSQLVKTNGFGAILRLFPEIYDPRNVSTNNYHKTIIKLKNRISWVPDPMVPMGTGRAFQQHLLDSMKAILFDG